MSIPDIRPQPYDPELDHDWYEYAGVEETEDSPTDERTATMFLKVVKRWDAIQRVKGVNQGI